LWCSWSLSDDVPSLTYLVALVICAMHVYYGSSLWHGLCVQRTLTHLHRIQFMPGTLKARSSFTSPKIWTFFLFRYLHFWH
jgi:hypothetical protein